MKPRKIENILKEDLNDYVSKVDVRQLWADIEQEVETIPVQPESDSNFNRFAIIGLVLFFCAVLYSLDNGGENRSLILEKGDTQMVFEDDSKDVAKEEKSTSKYVFEEDGQESKTTNLIGNEENTIKTGRKISFASQTEDNELIINNKELANSNSFTTVGLSNNGVVERSKPNFNSIPFSSLNKSIEEVKTNSKISNVTISPPLLDEILPINATFVDTTFLNIADLLKSDLQMKQGENEAYGRRSDFQISTGTYAGASLALRDLSDKTGEAIDYLQKRDNTETSLETLQAGLKVAVEHKSGIALQTGVQMMQITERFEFSGSRIRRDTVENGLYGFLINPNGDTIPVYDQIINTEELTLEKRTFNRYRFLDIPISVGYYLGESDWSIGLQAGIVVNLALKTKGEIFQRNEEITDLEANGNNLFKSNVGLSYRAALSGRYLINDNLQLEASVHARYFPKTFTQSSYSLNQKYTVLGVNVGANYLF